MSTEDTSTEKTRAQPLAMRAGARKSRRTQGAGEEGGARKAGAKKAAAGTPQERRRRPPARARRPRKAAAKKAAGRARRPPQDRREEGRRRHAQGRAEEGRRHAQEGRSGEEGRRHAQGGTRKARRRRPPARASRARKTAPRRRAPGAAPSAQAVTRRPRKTAPRSTRGPNPGADSSGDELTPDTARTEGRSTAPFCIASPLAPAAAQPNVASSSSTWRRRQQPRRGAAQQQEQLRRFLQLLGRVHRVGQRLARYHRTVIGQQHRARIARRRRGSPAPSPDRPAGSTRTTGMLRPTRMTKYGVSGGIGLAGIDIGQAGDRGRHGGVQVHHRARLRAARRRRRGA